MSKSALLEAAARAMPSPFRVAISLSLRGVLPASLAEHWAVEKIMPLVAPDGLLGHINGETFYVPTAGAFYYRRYEPVTRRVIEQSLRPGSVFADVGANVGYFSVIADRCGATVHAFEPGPPTLELLRRNLARHDARRTTVHPVALGSRDAVLTFHVSDDHLNSGVAPPPFRPVAQKVEVQQRRFDDVVSGQVDFVKIDIQGTELDALRGMTRTIRDNPQIRILAEWQPSMMRLAGYDPDDLPAFLRDHGLARIDALDDFDTTVRSIEDMREKFAADKTGRLYCNLLASRE